MRILNFEANTMTHALQITVSRVKHEHTSSGFRPPPSVYYEPHIHTHKKQNQQLRLYISCL